MTVGIFTKQSIKASTKPVLAGVAATAFIATVIWNLAIFGRFGIFLFAEHDSASDLYSYLDNVIPYTAFLVTGVLTYFFQKS
jgi:hypothetical protein